MFIRLLFLAVALLAPSLTHAQWRRATSDNFVVYSSGEDAALRRFTSKVEAFDTLLRQVTGVTAPPARKRLEIYLLRDAKDISRMLGKSGRYVAGLYTPRLAGSVALVPRSGGGGKFDLDGETVLFHEYAHHFMMQYFPSAYPPWYVEGFAEFYSTAEIDEKGVASIGKPAYHRAYGLILAKPFPIARLLSDKPQARGGEEVDTYYGRAWLLTHMLSDTAEGRRQLDAYLRAFASGTPAERAATDAFGPLTELEKRLTGYLGKPLRYRRFAGLDVKAAKIAVEPVDASQSALIDDRLNLLMGLDDQERPRVLASIRKDAARFPESPYALDMLIEAAELEQKETEAAALNDKLIALKPDYAPALLRKARMMMDDAGAAGSADAHWKAVRALIVRANRVNNDDATALYLYYQSFLRQGIKPTKAAVDGLWRTYQLAPQLDMVRITMAEHFIRENDAKSARNVLLPVAYDPHGGDSAEQARAMIARIDGERLPAPPKAETPGAEAAKN